MNLHGIVRRSIGSVNPQIPATLQHSTGFATGADFTPQPTYDTPIYCRIQVQAMTGRDLQQMELINQQGVLRAVYLNGQWAGLIRADRKGGDLLTFQGHTWLVVQVLESWPDWTKVAVAQQIP